MQTTSKQMIEWRDRILRTPKHLREFEEECGLRSIDRKIAMAQAEEERVATAVKKIEFKTRVFEALLATANYSEGVESRKPLLGAVSDLYMQVSR